MTLTVCVTLVGMMTSIVAAYSNLYCVRHSGRYNGWYSSCLHNLYRLHSYVDTRECCLLRDIKKATVKQIILEYINSDL